MTTDTFGKPTLSTPPSPSLLSSPSASISSKATGGAVANVEPRVPRPQRPKVRSMLDEFEFYETGAFKSLKPASIAGSSNASISSGVSNGGSISNGANIPRFANSPSTTTTSITSGTTGVNNGIKQAQLGNLGNESKSSLASKASIGSGAPRLPPIPKVSVDDTFTNIIETSKINTNIKPSTSTANPNSTNTTNPNTTNISNAHKDSVFPATGSVTSNNNVTIPKPISAPVPVPVTTGTGNVVDTKPTDTANNLALNPIAGPLKSENAEISQIGNEGKTKNVTQADEGQKVQQGQQPNKQGPVRAELGDTPKQKSVDVEPNSSKELEPSIRDDQSLKVGPVSKDSQALEPKPVAKDSQTLESGPVAEAEPVDLKSVAAAESKNEAETKSADKSLIIKEPATKPETDGDDISSKVLQSEPNARQGLNTYFISGFAVLLLLLATYTFY